MISRRQMLVSCGGAFVASGFGARVSLAAEPEKDLIFRTTAPRNAEPELEKLVRHWITPTRHFYVRSHAPNPNIDPADFRLRVEGMVRRPLTLSLNELNRFKHREVTATLTCAGNRRAEYNHEGQIGGVQWEAGAIGNANWSGVALADVLKRAEVTEHARHVWFEGLDEIERSDDVIPFGGSIPIDKAMSLDSPGAPLLALRMNGAPLTSDHGFPLRTVVPGYIGARSVKWLGRIVVSDRPSPNHYLATAYKLVKKTEPLDWAESGPIYRYPINAAICTPAADANLASGLIDVSGYALPTGRPGCKLTSVMISTDLGETWTAAETVGRVSDFCWQLWKARVRVAANSTELIVKADDSSGGFMPQRKPWNAKGYLQNSWYRLPIQVS